jgi:hypothetical protein
MADLTVNQVCNICCLHYNAGLRCCALGAAVEGGRLFAKVGGQAWIVAPAAQQVTRTWANRANAVTTAEAAAACGDWFVPSRIDLLLGQDCRSFWDSFTSGTYWTNTENNATAAWIVRTSDGVDNGNAFKTVSSPVRAFRRVFY